MAKTVSRTKPAITPEPQVTSSQIQTAPIDHQSRWEAAQWRTLQTRLVQSWHIAAAATLLFLVGFSIYLPAIRSGLHSDDWGLSTREPLADVLSAFHGHWLGGGPGTFYRPLSRLLIYMEARVFGHSGHVQHAISYLLFFGSAFLIALKTRQFLGDFCAALVLALILLNPLNTESVSWISSQTDLLCGFFLTLTFFVLIQQTEQLLRRHIYTSLMFAVLSYLSKDSAIYLGPLIVIYAGAMWLAGPRTPAYRKSLILALVSHMILWALYLLMRKVFLGSIVPVLEATTPPHGWFQHRMAIFYTVLREYSYALLDWFGAGNRFAINHASMMWMFLLIAGFFALLLYRRQYVLTALFAALMVTLFPVILAEHPYFYESMRTSRRYLYNANLLAPVCLVAALASARPRTLELKSIPALFLVLGFLFLAQIGSVTASQVLDWQAAGAVRESIRSGIAALAAGPRPVLLVVKEPPDHINEAFTFRNGFEEFARIYWPDISVQPHDSVQPQQFQQTHTIAVIDATAARTTGKIVNPWP